MIHERENARRHAYNTLAEVNRHMDRGNITNPRHYHMLADMAEKATRTLENLDRLDNARPYRQTDIGYNANIRQTNDAIRDAMDMVDKILPYISDNTEMRRGVPGTGRGRRYGRVRADMDDRYDVDDRYDDIDDDDMDDRYDMEVVNMPRWRSARTGRFLPNLYGPRRVRRVRRRRADLDDRTYADARYDRYDDMRYDDDDRTRSDHERRMDDAMARVAADAAADTARRMVDDRRDIYPHTPVMRYDARYDRYDRYDRRDDARYDARDERRSDTRYDARDDRRDDADTAFDRARKPGPDMTRR